MKKVFLIILVISLFITGCKLNLTENDKEGILYKVGEGYGIKESEGILEVKEKGSDEWVEFFDIDTGKIIKPLGFRIESENDPETLYWDGETGKVKINIDEICEYKKSIGDMFILDPYKERIGMLIDVIEWTGSDPCKLLK